MIIGYDTIYDGYTDILDLITRKTSKSPWVWGSVSGFTSTIEKVQLPGLQEVTPTGCRWAIIRDFYHSYINPADQLSGKVTS